METRTLLWISQLRVLEGETRLREKPPHGGAEGARERPAGSPWAVEPDRETDGRPLPTSVPTGRPPPLPGAPSPMSPLPASLLPRSGPASPRPAGVRGLGPGERARGDGPAGFESRPCHSAPGPPEPAARRAHPPSCWGPSGRSGNVSFLPAARPPLVFPS